MNPPYVFLKKYKNYEIFIKSTGFEPIPIAFGKVISFLVRDLSDTKLSLFAFAFAGLDSIQNPNFNEKDMLDKAIAKIEKYIDEDKVETNKENTFEYKNDEYEEVESPGWWIKTTTT